MRIAIVDDELNECSKLQDLLRIWADTRNISLETDTYPDAKQLLKVFSPSTYPVVFLDIYLGQTNGIQAARMLRQRDVSCIIIFLTSSPLHRADALYVHAFEYLEKPLAQERLSAVMDDAMALLTPDTDFLTMQRGKQSFRIPYSDIRCVLSDRQYCLIRTGQDERFRVPFRDVELQLSGDSRFLLINRGVLVNLDYVTSMEGIVCTMTDGSTHPIGTRRQREVQQAYISYQFEKRTKLIHR